MIYKRKLVVVAVVMSVVLGELREGRTCPSVCSCRHRTVRCATATRATLPRLPPLTQHLYLSGSSLPSLGPGDLSSLPHLSSLSLANTGLTTIHPGAFAQTNRLERLDLSYNQLQQLDSSTLASMPRLLVLKANNNKLVCISPSLSELHQLEVLSLQHNQLTSLPPALAKLARLRQLRLDRNRLECSCSTSWLATFLRRRPSLGLGAECASPRHLQGSAVSTLLSHQLPCPGPPGSSSGECGAAPRCPEACKCARGTVDCRNLGLTSLPPDIPADTKELRLERNHIEEIPAFAFRSAPGLRRIDLSRNRLARVAPEAFTYNKQLTTLILYDNHLSSLPPTSLSGLSNLQMILLNKNNLTCLPRKLFKDQGDLILLSLYDNQLTSLPERILAPLKTLSTLHLGANPWSCTCPLLWLSTFLGGREVGGAGAACDHPTRLRGQLLESVRQAEFGCGESGAVVHHAETCTAVDNCPPGCTCTHGTTDCRGAGLASLPHLPTNTHTLLLDRNMLTDGSDLAHACSTLPSLRKMSVRHNEVAGLEAEHMADCGQLEHLDLSHNRLAMLAGRFSGLQRLTKLGLLGNPLVCLGREVLESLVRVREVEVDLRYLPCTCASAWVRDWMVQRRAKVVNFHCTSTGTCPASPPSCSTTPACPEGCTCKGGVIQCNRLHLPAPPSPLPLLTTELLLSHNSITLSNNSSLTQAMVRLTLLDLSHNSISHLGPDSLPHLPHLTTLHLTSNRIQCITGGAFRRLPRLSVLSLGNNNLAGVQKTVFSSITTLARLELGGNPLHCDCRLAWLTSWLASRTSSSSSSPTCTSPTSLASRPLATLPMQAMVCTGHPRDPIQARCDPCFSTPCQHGGLCIRGDNLAFSCQCPSLYTGDRCEIRRDPCLDNPCRSGGQCRSRRGEVFCTCLEGWEGARCEININDCKNHACQNGGICRDHTAGYSCSCTAGWRGQFCQEREEPVAVAHTSTLAEACSLCQHGSHCTTSYTGASTCTCPHGYSGTYCEVAPSIQVLAYQQASPCLASPCQHGSCLASGTSGYTCRCEPGYSGKRCEYLTTVQLAGSGPYIQLDPLYTSRPLNLTLVVKTRESAGVLLYHGNTDHLAVELFHGRVRVSLNVGNPPASTMFSYAVLNDDKPHAVEMLLHGKNLTMRVDGGLARSLINIGSQEVLTVTSPTYLGGLPEVVGEAALSHWHLRNSTSLRGCITNFYIDDKTIDFLQAAHRRPGVLPGCHKRYLTSSLPLADSERVIEVSQERGGRREDRRRKKERRGKGRSGRRKQAGCEENRCREMGTRSCSPREGGNYRCKCKRGFTGRYCERAPSCRKKKLKKFMKENGCRSRKLVSQAACQGDCHGAACCRPRKMKKKKVGMICEDGTRYVKTVEVARKCACAKSRSSSSSCSTTNYKNLLMGRNYP